MSKEYYPRIAACLERLGEDDIWWRPNAASNSAGNLVLHLAGNIRQWITSGLGGALDIRDRDKEFSETGPLDRNLLAALLKREVEAACRTLRTLSQSGLEAEYTIQKFRRVRGDDAVLHVVEHFALHTGQIIYLTKLRQAKDLGFTRLPGGKRRKRKKESA
ncbi:MAG: DUF1572 family protein [Acidobacteriota bacterium]|nr:DUF1572 family protein [Acidobacteriota bacterium]